MQTALKLRRWENYNRLKTRGFFWNDFFEWIVGRGKSYLFFLPQGILSKRRQQIILCIFALHFTNYIIIKYYLYYVYKHYMRLCIYLIDRHLYA